MEAFIIQKESRIGFAPETHRTNQIYQFRCSKCNKNSLPNRCRPTFRITDGYGQPVDYYSPIKKYSIGLTCRYGHFHWVAQGHSEEPLERYRIERVLQTATLVSPDYARQSNTL